MSDYYNNQYSSGLPAGSHLPPSQHQYAASERGYYPPPPQKNQGSYRPPQDDTYRRGSAKMQVGPYQDDYDDRPHHHRQNHGSTAGYSDYSRSKSHERSSSSFDENSGSRRGSSAHAKKPSQSKQKELGATVVGGAVGALAAHELGHGHHDMMTVVGGLAGAWAGNKLEKKHEKKKEDKERRASEVHLVRDEDGRRRGSHDLRRGYNENDYSSESESDVSQKRRHH